MATPLGIQCITFLAELANAKAQNPGWEPTVYITATCASPLILGAAGEAADGIYTSAAWVCTTSPTRRTQRSSRSLRTSPRWRPRASATSSTTGVAGWNAAEVTVADPDRGGRVGGRAHPGVDHQRRPQP